jgi:monoamine oxidase
MLVTGKSRPVIIIGGGLAGLTTALALHRVGIPCVVFEQQEELTGRSGTVTVFRSYSDKMLKSCGA